MKINNKGNKSFQHQPMAEINVTPLVDVMLVLLIIFMITAPLLTTGVSVELPTTESKAVPGQDEPLTITINKNREIFIGDNIVKTEALIIKLNAIAGLKKQSRIFMSLVKSIGNKKQSIIDINYMVGVVKWLSRPAVTR